MNHSDAITIEKFDVNFFKTAEQKKQELHQLADGSDTIANFKTSEETKQEVRKFVNEFAAPLEAKAFEAGRRAGLAEASENIKTRVMEKIALSRELVDPTKKESGKDAQKRTDPREQVATAQKLAKEAKEFVATEEKAGRTVTMAEAMKHVYEKAGVPTR
jgi:hypothetical protein